MKELTSIGSMDAVLRQTAINQILETNSESMKYGLMLTENDAMQILDSRNDALRGFGRIELGADVIQRLIFALCDSPYIVQEQYASVLCELIEAFYYMKNETLDEMGDDELVLWIKDSFNNRCNGSVELLLGGEFENTAREIRNAIYSRAFITGEDVH